MLKKKEKGMVDDFLPIVAFILLAAILIFMFINYNAAVNKKTEINFIARKYLLMMETQGYLTDGMKADLIQELEDEGFYGTNTKGAVSASNLAGTTMSNVGYGNEITIVIEVYSNVKMLGSTDIFQAFFTDKIEQISISYSSTSKE